MSTGTGWPSRPSKYIRLEVSSVTCYSHGVCFGRESRSTGFGELGRPVIQDILDSVSLEHKLDRGALWNQAFEEGVADCSRS